MTLVEFLLARVAEDEIVAHIRADRGRAMALAERSAFGVSHMVVGDAFDPARVLAECAAKRAIVGMAEFSDSPESAVDFWLAEGKGRTAPPRVDALIDVVRTLAAVYSNHPDYRAEWRP